MIVYMEAHPIVVDMLFAAFTVGAFIIGSTAVCRSIERTRVEILKAISSRNHLLREGFAAIAGLLANKPCNKTCCVNAVECTKSDTQVVTTPGIVAEDAK